LSDELPADLRPIVDFFGLPNTAVVAKDFHVVRAIRALVAFDAAPFALIFGGGTALARAHKLVQRMSEDVDFKMVLRTPPPLSRSALQRQLALLRERVSAALLAAGFVFDPHDRTHTWARNEYRYNVYHLPYEASGTALRPTLQVELTYATLRCPAVTCAVGSLVAEALGHAPEVPALPCVSVTETATEKLVWLTRRMAMELAGLSRNPDPTLVRHIYDLHLIQAHLDHAEVAVLARDIAAADAADHDNQHPAYQADMRGETRKVMAALARDPVYRARYNAFMGNMVHGQRPDFDQALGTVQALAALFCAEEEG
jgi:predicted nucleotidyltransferase component of viral defense system